MGADQAYPIEPINRRFAPAIKLSCCAYSYRDYLQANKQPQLSLEQFMDTCAELGLDGTELTSYYFNDTSEAYLHQVKRHAFLLGLDVSGSAVGNTFTLPPGEQRDGQVAMTKQWVERAALLGAPCLRVFAGSVPEGATVEQARAWCIECLQECLPVAEQHGVMLALENHGGITDTAEHVLSIITAVDSDWLGLNLDTGNFHTADPYADLAAAAPYAVTTHLKSEIHPAGGEATEVDCARLIAILQAANYRGYLSLEYEAAEDPLTAVPKVFGRVREALAGG